MSIHSECGGAKGVCEHKFAFKVMVSDAHPAENAASRNASFLFFFSYDECCILKTLHFHKAAPRHPLRAMAEEAITLAEFPFILSLNPCSHDY
jgi:hypothetical protein